MYEKMIELSQQMPSVRQSWKPGGLGHCLALAESQGWSLAPNLGQSNQEGAAVCCLLEGKCLSENSSLTQEALG